MSKTLKKKIIGYTAGAFDLFHVGHLNLLRNAKSMCDELIVGVTVDELAYTKKKKFLIPFKERIEIVENIKFVDRVVPQTDLDKYKAWKELKYDILFSGDDWKGVQRWINYENKLSKKGVKVIYFPYTRNVSSTKIISLIEDLVKELEEY